WSAMSELEFIVGVTLIIYAVRGLYDGYRSADPNRPRTHVCTHCRSHVNPVTIKPGSTILEILLWLFFIIPGIFYTLYCSTHKKNLCPVCKAENPIPISTPAGQALAQTAK